MKFEDMTNEQKHAQARADQLAEPAYQDMLWEIHYNHERPSDPLEHLERNRIKHLLLEDGRIRRRRVDQDTQSYFEGIGCTITIEGLDMCIMIPSSATMETLRAWRQKLDGIRALRDEIGRRIGITKPPAGYL
jgi:hypothetical protein